MTNILFRRHHSVSEINSRNVHLCVSIADHFSELGHHKKSPQIFSEYYFSYSKQLKLGLLALSFVQWSKNIPESIIYQNIHEENKNSMKCWWTVLI